MTNIDMLLDGYRRFRAETWPAERARYESLAQGQQAPDTLIVACSDSRVDPATIFGARPGELFVVRNVAALVPPYQPDAGCHGTSAALEFGVRVLKVARIVVLGHAQCGGVRAMVEGAPEEARDFVASWVAAAEPVLDSEPAEGADRFTYYETEVVRLSLANLLTFPWISSAVERGELQLEGFYFGIESGVLARLQGERFVGIA